MYTKSSKNESEPPLRTTINDILLVSIKTLDQTMDHKLSVIKTQTKGKNVSQRLNEILEKAVS